MRKAVLLFVVFLLVSVSSFYAQTLNDYVSEVRGDTLVIKDYIDMSESSTLTSAVTLDTAPPAGRVYMLKANGYYPLATNLSTPAERAVIIVGADKTRLAVNKNASSAPPLICGSVVEGGSSNSGGINFGNDLTIKNAEMMPAVSDGTLGWAFIGDAAADKKVVFENCMFERTKWVIMQSNNDAGNRFFIKDCYFVNLSGQACRRNGGVYDNVNNNTDTMWVENTTHVMAQGMIYKFRNYPVGKVFFNHNTFVNCSGNVLETLGYQSNFVVVNNIFVNSNVQPYFPGLDAGETDADNKPMGIINVRALTADMVQLDRKVLVDGNVVYFDSKLNDMVATLNTQKINFREDWVSQMITMNDRTQAMFNDNTTYPYLTEGVWYNEMPSFTDPKDLFTDQLDALKEFSVLTVDTTSTNIMPEWRVVNTGADNYVYSDWPIPVDLSYNNANLLKGAYGGFPVGDLNWFPAKKAQWEAQRTTELAAIEAALNSGNKLISDVKEVAGRPVDFRLEQNYPNPFNPATVINFSIPKAANVTLKVYNTLGQEVATLIDGYKNASNYQVTFDASKLASGVYVYTLQAGDFSFSKKMMLVK
jgi:hypothetical protein